MTSVLTLAFLQAADKAKTALQRVGDWLSAAIGPLFVVESKLVALFLLLSIVDMATAGLFAEGRVIRSGRWAAGRLGIFRFLQNLIGTTVMVWISNGFAFFTFLGPWVIAYVCLRVARHIINAVTPAESDLRQLWERFWKVFYDKNADVIETTAKDSMRSTFRRAQGLPDDAADPSLPADGSSEVAPDVQDTDAAADPYGDLR